MEHNGDVRGVEQFDGVRSLLSSLLGILHGEIHTETLEVDNNDENEDCSEEVGNVREVLPVECLLESTDLVVTGEQEVEKGDDGSLKLSSTASVDGGGAESFPNNVLTNVGGNEQRNTRSKTVTPLEKRLELFKREQATYFCKSSSKMITMIPAKNNWMMINNAFPAPRTLSSPYIPDAT